MVSSWNKIQVIFQNESHSQTFIRELNHCGNMNNTNFSLLDTPMELHALHRDEYRLSDHLL